MPPTRLTVLAGTATPPTPRPDEQVIHLRDLKRWVRSGAIAKHLFRYAGVTLRCADVGLVPRPLTAAILLRVLSRGPCAFEDEQGRRLVVGPWMLLSLAWASLRQCIEKPAMRRAAAAELDGLERAKPQAACRLPAADLERGRVVYIYADLTLGIKTGGAVSHVTGVLNALAHGPAAPVLIAATAPPTLDKRVTVRLVRPTGPWDGFEGMALRFNQEIVSHTRGAVTDGSVSFIYQRNTVNTFAGLVLARALQRPLVVEFNGSEVWAQRHWGKPLRDEKMAARVERLMLTSADVVVAVSETIRDELTAMGVGPSRIVVNPNGVDAERYRPDIDGTPVRERCGLGNATVIGFIGTFGKWHGAEVLVEAVAELLRETPQLRGRIKLLMIGDGERARPARDLAARLSLDDTAVFTGPVPQDQGPSHLAACDILAAPHVPNPDGSPFFGSPTKLFEYMAMGRGIVASRLGQIARVLDDGRNALLVEPGDARSLATGLRKVIESPDMRTEMGAAARRDAVERHTWDRHTRRIVDKVRECCACD
ncbi:MAG: glycosyltransferase [Planctomycetes bacterium]|nr:glycosyltransferase [Planctomycetota bacterium]